MKKSIILITAFAAVILGAVALVARPRRSSSTSTPTGTDTPTTPAPQDPDDTSSPRFRRIDLTQFRPGGNRRRVRISSQRVPRIDRSATQAESAALLRRDLREPRPVDDYAAPVVRSHSTLDRKKTVMFPDLSPEVRDAFVIFLYEEVGMSHREISHIIALSPRAIAHRLHAVGAVRYTEEVESSQNRNNSNQ